MKRATIILCMCLLASGCAPRTVAEDAEPTEQPSVILTLAEDPAPIAYRVCAREKPDEPAKVYRDIPLSHALQDVADKACEEYGILPDSLMAYNLGEGGAKRLWKQGIHDTSYTRKVLESMDGGEKI